MPSVITRCQLLWNLPELGLVSSDALAEAGASRVVDALVAPTRSASFQLGFYIDVDGVPWSDEATVDEPLMTWSWVYALERLLAGHREAGAHPWEESSLELVRDGDVVTMQDIHGSGLVVMRRVEVPFIELATRMHEELASMARVIRAVRSEARARLARDGLRREVRRELEGILGWMPDEEEFGLPAVDRLGWALGR